MRNLPPIANENNEEAAVIAEGMLRADEVLIPAGGVSFSCGSYKFFAAASDEDFMNKEQKLRHRREQRKRKRA